MMRRHLRRQHLMQSSLSATEHSTHSRSATNCSAWHLAHLIGCACLPTPVAGLLIWGLPLPFKCRALPLSLFFGQPLPRHQCLDLPGRRDLDHRR
mgnify:CR=1 FL=1